jgi:hypothetical protein
MRFHSLFIIIDINLFSELSLYKNIILCKILFNFIYLKIFVKKINKIMKGKLVRLLLFYHKKNTQKFIKIIQI